MVSLLDLSTSELAALRRERASDPHRPRYHFLPPANWMNDPNGLIHWQGAYHLFYQLNPFDPGWGYIHWGHAASPDLVHWRDLPIALYPGPGSPKEDGCWTGCALDDHGAPTLLYTEVQNGQELVFLATGDRRLITWQKHPRNPVIAGPPAGLQVTGFRDPFVWREDGSWNMVIGSGVVGAGGAVLLYRSPDLLDWEYLGPLLVGEAAEHGTIWECPNFLQFGDRRVLVVSLLPTAYYFTGPYAAGRFTPGAWREVDYGRHFYAPQVMRDGHGRYLMFGWLLEGRSQDAQRAAGWSGVMSLPRLLSLSAGGALVSTPAPELAALRGERARFAGLQLEPDSERDLPLEGVHLELAAEFAPGKGACGLQLCCLPGGEEATLVGYDPAAGQLFVDRRRSSLSAETRRDLVTAPLPLDPGETLKLRVFLDGSVLEVFANRRLSLTSRIYPTRPDSAGVGLFAGPGGARLISLEAWQMGSIWD